MVDLSHTIAPKSDQLNADDLIAGPRTIRITRVEGREEAEQPVSIYFEGDGGRPYKPGLSMRRVMVQVWGADADQYIGRMMTLYRDPEVAFGGMKVGGIRISHMSHIPRETRLMLTKTRGKKSEFTVLPLAASASEALILAAEEAAAQGSDAYRAFWGSQSPANQKALLPFHEQNKTEAAKADEAKMSLAERINSGGGQSASQADDVVAHWTDDIDTSEAFPGDEVFTEGVKGFQDGIERAACPYASNDPAAVQWLGGWDQAQKAAE